MTIDIDRNLDQAELDRLLAKLSYTGDAVFNSYHLQHEPRCIPNTRVGLLHRLEGWSKSSKECIFWLSGKAGTGKPQTRYLLATSTCSQISSDPKTGEGICHRDG